MIVAVGVNDAVKVAVAAGVTHGVVVGDGVNSADKDDLDVPDTLGLGVRVSDGTGDLDAVGVADGTADVTQKLRSQFQSWLLMALALGFLTVRESVTTLASRTPSDSRSMSARNFSSPLPSTVLLLFRHIGSGGGGGGCRESATETG